MPTGQGEAPEVPDWPPAQQVNRQQLLLIIAGLSDGVILIGVDQRLTYANAAALHMYGVGCLEDLGGDIDAFRQRFILRYRDHHETKAKQHPIERVMAGEVFRDVLVEVARADSAQRKRIHQIRSLVINDPAGEPHCLVLILQDVTDRFEAENRFERTFSANPAPAVICRLADLRYVKVNKGFLQLTGFSREDVLGKTVCEVDVLREAERRELAMAHLHEGRTIPQMEACLRVPIDAEKHVIVAGHPIEMPGAVPCMLFTFADLEDRTKAEAALRQSEERFSKAFQLAPVPTALVQLDGFRLIGVNDAFASVFGCRVEDAVRFRPAASGLWVEYDAERRFARLVAEHGRVRGFEARFRSSLGEELDCLVSAERVTIAGEECVLCSLQDISARKRSEGELVRAIEAVMADASWFSQEVIERLATLRRPPPADRPAAQFDGFTAREREVLVLIGRGATDGEIGIALGMARNTMRNHLAAIYRKLGVNRRSAVVVWARERGLGDASEPGAGTQRAGAKRPANLVRKNQEKT